MVSYQFRQDRKKYYKQQFQKKYRMDTAAVRMSNLVRGFVIATLPTYQDNFYPPQHYQSKQT